MSDWSRLEPLFDAALDLPLGARRAFVEAATAGEEALRHRLLRLLEAHEQMAPDFLEAPAAARHTDAWADALSGLQPGDRVGPYVLDALVGRGGMATVYRAHRADGQFEQTVALKLLARHAPVHRFLAERQILAALDHPHIAPLLDGGRADDGRPYLVMAFVEGEPFDRYAAARPVEARLRLFVQACEAVAYAHRRLVVHRDLKPSNILVTPEGQVKLLDFGIAKLLDPDQAEALALTPTQADLRPMTAAYAAPEQLEGGLVTTATDVYALGGVLYEVLTGRRPYQPTGETPSALLRAMETGLPVRPSLVDGTAVPPRHRADLDAICLKALRYEPEQRYASVEALAEDVRRHLEGRPVQARGDAFGYRLRRFVRRNRLAVGLGLALLVALVGGLGAALGQARVAQRERDRATQAARTAEETTRFLVALFQQALPTAGGDTLTVIDAMEVARRRIATDLQDQPDAAARLSLSLGALYRELGRLSTADTLLTQGLALASPLVRADTSLYADALRHLAWLRIYQGDDTAADTLLAAALRLTDAAPLTYAAPRLNALGLLLSVRNNQRRWREGDSLGRAAVALARQTGDPGHLAAMQFAHSDLLIQRRRYAEAAEALQAAVSGLAATHGPTDRRTLLARLQWATALVLTADTLAADTLLRRLETDLRRDTRQIPTTFLAEFYDRLGGYYDDRGAPALAEPHVHTALALKQQLGLPYSATLERLAGYQERQGRLLNALATRADALRLGLNEWGADDPWLAGTQFRQARLLQRLGRAADAQRLLADLRRTFARQPDILAEADYEEALLACSRGERPAALLPRALAWLDAQADDPAYADDRQTLLACQAR